VAEEYDVDTKLTLDDKPARAALLRVAEDFDNLYAHAVKTGQAIRSAMAGFRAETKAYATTVGIANARMNNLAMSTAKVGTATKPLAQALERANTATSKLAVQGQKAGSALTSSFERAGRAGSGLGGVVRSALGFASAYVGVQALTGAFRGLVTQAFAFQAVNDKNRVSLGAVLAASDSFKSMGDPAERMVKAGQVGDAIFRQLQGDALKSVATSQELAGIYTGISGPLLGAGAHLSEIRQITNDTVSAASVLGVDFEQASRDIMQMSTGAAGMDTKLFRMLQSTKAITQSSKEWNELLPEKRVEAMKKALAQFGPAGKAFEKTLPGITSSFVDFMQRFRGAFMSGPLELVRKTLVRMVGVFDANQTKIIAVLTVLGNALARVFEPVINAMSRVVDYFLNNWETIASTIEASWAKLMRMGAVAAHYAPALGAGAKAAGGAALLGKIAPGALGGGLGAVKAGLAGGPAAGAGSIATVIAEITHLISVVVAMGGAFTIILPIVAVLVGLFAVLSDTWSHLVPILAIVGTYVQTIFSGMWGLIVAVFNALMPLLKIIGVVVGSLFALGAILMSVFGRLFLAVFGGIMSVLTTIFEYLGKGFTWVYDHIVSIFTDLLDFFGAMHSDLMPKGGKTSSGGFLAGLRMDFDRAMAGFSAQEKTDASLLSGAEGGAPSSRKTTINDFRGSKIEVKQDFRSASPDNVWLQMMEGLNSAADQRLTSALVPDFSR
jgi:hypothetical protein